MTAYPKTVNAQKWMLYLDRALSRKEFELLCNLKCEMDMNKRLKKLYARALENDLYVPELSDLVGNCLFESLVYHGVCDSVSKLRNIVAYILFQFKNSPDLVKGTIPIESFNLEVVNGIYDEDVGSKEIFVYSKKSRELVTYTYDMMCRAITMDRCWHILPNNLILAVISKLYHLRIHIITESSTSHCINAYDDEDDPDDMRDIYLGFMVENHYIPLDKIENCPDESWLSFPIYNEEKKEFKKWGEKMEAIKIMQMENQESDDSYGYTQSSNPYSMFQNDYGGYSNFV